MGLDAVDQDPADGGSVQEAGGQAADSAADIELIEPVLGRLKPPGTPSSSAQTSDQKSGVARLGSVIADSMKEG